MKQALLNLLIIITFLNLGFGQDQKLPYKSKMADLGEIKMQYMDFGGEGIPFIWVQDFHNYFEGPYSKFPEAAERIDFFTKLSKYAHVLAPLRRGYGKSTFTKWGYDVATQGEDILKFMDELGIEKAILFARLPGNQDITWIAEHHPERISGLVYWDGNPILIVGCGNEDEILLMESWSAFAPDFEKEQEKRLVMSRAFWRPHFLSDKDSRIKIPAIRLLSSKYDDSSVISRISERERLQADIANDNPKFKEEVLALKTLVEDTLRYNRLREHLLACDPSKKLDEGMERAFGSYLQTELKIFDYDTDDYAEYIAWELEKVIEFIEKLK
ncbi:alpha/beta fold hydrolase [Aegicerativicinus sediminis]|uniref:alpha/beta fold hydrolase n=1 Tax=Aegicerativicinus sediminis TaxID=2893202 RepID=UPI001E4ECD9D|nr:alpha/beta hydrolase [Aegicerativicinus sediminis]